MTRLADITRLYSLLSDLEQKTRWRFLSDPNLSKTLPSRGVYFFFDATGVRSDSGHGKRLVRIGTHALISGAKERKIWDRLRNHRGTENGNGTHRGSVFRMLVGDAIIRRDNLNVDPDQWNSKGLSPTDLTEDQNNAEEHVERLVSNYICSLPFLCLDIDDEPGPASSRAIIETNSIALASNWRLDNNNIDALPLDWLGNHSVEKVQNSSLWNRDFVDEDYDPTFLSELAKWVKKI